MKKILFYLILSFYSIQLCAQIIPNYTFRYGNFYCQDDSEFCILFDYNENPTFPSSGVYLQLEYKTNDFIEVEWYDFTLTVPGPPNTLWEQEIIDEFSGDIVQEYCFRGIIQDPDVEITVRFIDRNVQPEEVLSVETFKLRRNLPIVGNGGVIKLSDIVGVELLTVSQAAIQDQQFVLDGTLEVDLNYAFSTSLGGSVVENELIMTPGSQIVVKSGNMLRFNRSRLTSCGIWDGIKVESNSDCVTSRFFIERAEKAFDMDENSRVVLQSAILKNNQYGVYSVLPTKTFITLEIFASDLFGGVDRVIFESDNSPFSYDVGIYTRDVSHIVVDNFVNFEGLTTGIDCRNTDLFIGDPSSFNIKPSFQNVDHGIVTTHAENAWINAYFDNCEKHCILYSNIQNTNIEECDFWNSGTAIQGSTAEINEHTLVDNNFFFNVENGFLGVMRPSRGEIQYNDMNSTGHSIMILGLGSGTHTWAVQNNDKISSSNSKNVWLRRTNLARIHENWDISSGGNHNVEIHGGNTNYVGCNVMTTSGGNNLKINGSDMFETYCNELTSSALSNVLVKNNCGMSTVRTQTMTSGTYNLEYDALSLTGPQLDRGNIFDVSTLSNKKALHDGNSVQAERSFYRVPLPIWRNNEAQGVSKLFPYFESMSDDWFRDLGGPAESCGPNNGCLPPGVPGGPGNEVSEEDNAWILYDYINSGEAANHGVEVLFDAQYKLMQSLLVMNDDNTLTGVLLTYYQNNLNTEAYHLAYVEHVLKGASQMTSVDIIALDDLTEDLEDYVDQYQNLVWYSFDSMTGEVVYDLMAMVQRDQLMNDIEDVSDDIALIRSSYSTNWTTELGNMLTYNAGITTSTVSGQNLKSVNDVYISYSLSGENILTSPDLTMVQNVASMCYVEGGEGVLLARNLEANHLGSVTEYSDNCSPPSLKSGLNDQKEAIGIPNPSNGNLVLITIPQDKISRKIDLIDVLGRVVMTTLSEKQVDLSYLPTGIYYIRSASSSDKSNVSGMIIIEKR